MYLGNWRIVFVVPNIVAVFANRYKHLSAHVDDWRVEFPIDSRNNARKSFLLNLTFKQELSLRFRRTTQLI